MKKSLTLLILIASISVHGLAYSQGFFDNLKTGLANIFDQSKSRLEVYQKSADKALLNQFYYLSEDGREQGVNKSLGATKFDVFKVTPFAITLRQSMFREGRMVEIAQKMQSYSYDPLSDPIAKRYVEFGAERGNQVKLYKPALAWQVNRLLPQSFQLNHDRNTAEWINVDNLLIEWTSQGKVVSVLTRSHQAIVNIGANSQQYVNIYFGNELSSVIENKIKNSDLADNFIRIVSLLTSPESAKAVAAPLLPAPLTSSEANLPNGSSSVSPPTNTGANLSNTPLGSMEQRVKLLRNLGDLKNAGLLSEAEFDAQKKKILEN